MDDDNIFDREQRFEIFVPSPKARINMGKPNLTSNDEGPFGYTGLSLQSDVHLFIDANKHTLFQTGQNYCGQVGGKWLQYSNADMIMSSTASVNLSADKKIVIAYEQELKDAGKGFLYSLPLHFQAKVDRFRLRAEVFRQEVAPDLGSNELVNLTVLFCCCNKSVSGSGSSCCFALKFHE